MAENNVYEKLQDYHNIIIKKVESDKKLNKAREITENAFKIKKLQIEGEEIKENGALATFYKKAIKAQIKEGNAKLQASYPKLSKLFMIPHSYNSNLKTNDIVETQIAATVAAVMKDKKVIDKILTGRDQELTSQQVFLNGLEEKQKKDLLKLLNKTFHAKMEKEEKDLITKKANKADMDLREIKEDELDIEIKNGENPYFKLIKSMIGYTYSIKNYLESSLKSYGVSVGDSGLYKAVTGGMLKANESNQENFDLFVEGTKIINQQRNEYQEIINHFMHLKFIFELEGLGYSKTVDFLFINVPLGVLDNNNKRSYSNNVYVIPPELLEKLYLKKEKNNNYKKSQLAGDIKISQNLLESAIQELKIQGIS